MPRIEVMGDRAGAAEPGHMASAIVALSTPEVGITAVRLPSEADMVVYARRVDTTLEAAGKYCAERAIPLLVMSTGTEDALPERPDYPLIIAPNTSIRVLRFLERVRKQGSLLEGWATEVTEHHQPSKVDVAGTAIQLAASLGLRPEEIVSVRDFGQSWRAYPAIANADVPHYAAHDVQFTNLITGDQESSGILVVGHEEYARGVLAIHNAVRRPDVRNYIAEAGNKVSAVTLFEEGFLT